MLEGLIQSATVMTQCAANGGLFAQIVESLTSQSADRNDIVFALTLMGVSFGAGTWIGVEIIKFIAHFFRSLGRALKGQTDQTLVFKRPERSD